MFLVAGLAGANAVVSSVQVAVLLQRAPVLRQPAAVRDGPGVREDAAALCLHCYAAAAAGAGEAGEGQTAAGEADSDPHPLPEVRESSWGLCSVPRLRWTDAHQSLGDRTGWGGVCVAGPPSSHPPGSLVGVSSPSEMSLTLGRLFPWPVLSLPILRGQARAVCGAAPGCSRAVGTLQKWSPRGGTGEPGADSGTQFSCPS